MVYRYSPILNLTDKLKALSIISYRNEMKFYSGKIFLLVAFLLVFCEIESTEQFVAGMIAILALVDLYMLYVLKV